MQLRRISLVPNFQRSDHQHDQTDLWKLIRVKMSEFVVTTDMRKCQGFYGIYVKRWGITLSKML